jgi:hypothetical protein
MKPAMSVADFTHFNQGEAASLRSNLFLVTQRDAKRLNELGTLGMPVARYRMLSGRF